MTITLTTGGSPYLMAVGGGPSRLVRAARRTGSGNGRLGARGQRKTVLLRSWIAPL